MKEIFSKKIKLNVWIIIVLVILVIICVCWKWYTMNTTSPVGAVLGSIIAGLIVALIQLGLSWWDYQMMQKIEKLRLIKILYDRDNRTYYANIIDKSRREIRVMGTTARRFFEHFADMTTGARPEAQVLISALNRGVKVKLLLPSKDYIALNKIADYNQVSETLNTIKQKYPHAEIDIRYFDHIPAHSIFMVDSECIVGPIFEYVESKNTPALHLKNESPFAEKYLAYFEQEWDKVNG